MYVTSYSKYLNVEHYFFQLRLMHSELSVEEILKPGSLKVIFYDTPHM